jgi:hypothetical protein
LSTKGGCVVLVSTPAGGGEEDAAVDSGDYTESGIRTKGGCVVPVSTPARSEEEGDLNRRTPRTQREKKDCRPATRLQRYAKHCGQVHSPASAPIVLFVPSVASLSASESR